MMNSFDLSLFHQTLDHYFGLPTLEVEDTAEELHSEGLLTSYLDYFHLFLWLKNQQISSLTDLGAGLGRSSLCARQWFADFDIIGVEKDQQRVELAKSVGVNLIHDDLENYFSSELYRPTQSYYLYFPWGPCLYPFLRELNKQVGALVIVTESYGDFLPLLMVHAPWLKLVEQIPSVSQRLSDKIEIYRVEEDTRPLNPVITSAQDLAAWLLCPNNSKTHRLHFEIKEDKQSFSLDEVELAYYPDRGFTIERLRPRRLFWWSDLDQIEVLPKT